MALAQLRNCTKNIFLVIAVVMATLTMMLIFSESYTGKTFQAHKEFLEVSRRFSGGLDDVSNMEAVHDGGKDSMKEDAIFVDNGDKDDKDDKDEKEKDYIVVVDNDNDDGGDKVNNDEVGNADKEDDHKKEDNTADLPDPPMDKKVDESGGNDVKVETEVKETKINEEAPNDSPSFVEKKQKKARKIVILTYMRSGSTLTGDLFQHHPDVFYVFEPLWKLQKYYRNLTDTIGFLDGRAETETRTMDQFWSRASMSTEVLENMLSCRFENLDTGTLMMGHLGTSICTRPYLHCVKSKRNKFPKSIHECLPKMQQPCLNASVSVVKTIRYTIDQLEVLLTSDPEVKVIHLFRDPRATYLSQTRVGEYKNVDKHAKLETFCNRMLKDLNDALGLSQNFRDRILTVRYEDIVQYPIAAAKVMYDFVGLELTQKVKDYIWSITYAGNKRDPKKCRQLCTMKTNSTETAYKWRKSLGFHSVTDVDRHCSKVHDLLGYRKFTDLAEYKSMAYSSSYGEFGEGLRTLNTMSLKHLETMPESKMKTTS